MSLRLLYPIALIQGLWVRQTTPRLPPARGRRGGYGTGTEALRIVGLGDSIIAGVGVDRQEHSLVGHFARRLHEQEGRPTRWQTHGFNGATSALIHQRIAPRVPPADVYVVSAGVNDAVRAVSPQAFARNLRGLVETLRSKAPQATVIFAGIPPFESFPSLPWPLGALLGDRSARLQAAARVLSRSIDVVCFDFPPRLAADGFAPDGFHPAAAACDEWAGWLLDAWLSPARRAIGSPGPAAASPPA